MPPSRSARAAPASTVTVPVARLGVLEPQLEARLADRLGCEARAAPARLRPRARARPGISPLPITVAIPAAEAISAAMTFERIPPEPSGDGACPICERFQLGRVGDLLDEPRAGDLARIGGVEPFGVGQEHEQRRLPTSTATCAARKSLSPNEISSVVVVSFSLITGTIRHSSSLRSVRRALR